jgi:DNA-binding GntR family transcriptional regulator
MDEVELSSLAEKVFHIIESSIWRGEMKPGERVYDHRIAAQFGISRSPVREALKRLEHFGLIRVVPRRGTYVAQMTSDEVADLMDIREALEGMAARKAALRVSAATVEAMRQELAPLRDRAETSGLSEYPQVSTDFHDWVVETSGNPKIKTLMRAIQGQIHLIRFRSGASPERAPRAVREHLDILDAIAHRDADLAEARIRAHIRAARENILSVWPSPSAA